MHRWCCQLMQNSDLLPHSLQRQCLRRHKAVESPESCGVREWAAVICRNAQPLLRQELRVVRCHVNDRNIGG
jgi:hypothetical protein